MTKKTLLILFLLFAPTLSFGQQPSASELKKIEARAKQKNVEQKNLEKKASEVASDIKIVSKEMIKTAKAIQNNESKLSKMEQELEELKENLKIAEDNFITQDQNLIKTLGALENLALKPTEALFVQPLNPVEIIRSAILLRESVPHLEENAKKIKQELHNIEIKKKRIETQIKRISISKNKMQQEHSNMTTLAQKKKNLQKSLKIKSEKTKEEAERLASQAKDIRELFNKIEKQRKAKELAQEQERQKLASTAQEKNMGTNQSYKLHSKKSHNIIDSNAFQVAKGNISMPAIGHITTTFGQETKKGLHSKGITIQTRAMAQITAPFDGNVMFAGPFRGYGNLIIIDHGGGYISLLSGLKDISCELGQDLLAGEPIGTMPQTQSSQLYLEIRKNNNPLNPLHWIKKG